VTSEDARHLLGPAEHSIGTLLAKQIRAARRRATAVTVFRGVLEGPIGQAFLDLLECLDPRPLPENATIDVAGASPAGPRGSAVAATYARVFNALATDAAPGVDATDAWQSHLLWRVIDDENTFSRQAERLSVAALPPSLLDQARRDLRGLQWLYALGADAVREAAVQRTGVELAEALAPWHALASPAAGDDPRLRMARRLATGLDWGALAEELAAHWHAHGLGLFARHRAATWANGHLEPVRRPDAIRLTDLVEYDRERAPLLRNTEYFAAGKPAHHCLIYGERGTGKSSTVKALLNAFGDRGVRLVELDKGDLQDLETVLDLLRDHPQRFILFVDDLSFEEHETQYKALKSALEGRIEEWPENVVIYVTTNRRHLVSERFSDRDGGGNGEIRPRDTMEEKLSLADRFGLQIAFPTPDQERYVAIATALARAHAVALPEGELRSRAIQWALWHNGRSCRSARQFVDELRAGSTQGSTWLGGSR